MMLLKDKTDKQGESQSDTHSEDLNNPALPPRCRHCSDLPNCDLDFCLRWWH